MSSFILYFVGQTKSFHGQPMALGPQFGHPEVEKRSRNIFRKKLQILFLFSRSVETQQKFGLHDKLKQLQVSSGLTGLLTGLKRFLQSVHHILTENVK